MAIIDYVNKIKEKYDYIIVSVISPLKKNKDLCQKKIWKKIILKFIQNVI